MENKYAEHGQEDGILDDLEWWESVKRAFSAGLTCLSCGAKADQFGRVPCGH